MFRLVVLLCFCLNSTIGTTELNCYGNSSLKLDCAVRTTCMESVPTRIFDACAKNSAITSVNLSGNNLKTVNELTACFHIENLDLSHNSIESLSLESFRNLQIVDLSFNGISDALLKSNFSFGNESDALLVVTLEEDENDLKLCKSEVFSASGREIILLCQKEIYRYPLPVITTTTSTPASTTTISTSSSKNTTAATKPVNKSQMTSVNRSLITHFNGTNQVKAASASNNASITFTILLSLLCTGLLVLNVILYRKLKKQNDINSRPESQALRDLL